jgi:hypothetical protein
VLLLALALALPDALLNRPYVPEARWEKVSTRCAMPIPTTRVVGGSLPPGLQMSGRGEVEGVPTEPGDFTFAVEVSDGCARRVEQRRIRVMPAPILLAEAETLEYHCVHGAPPFSGGIVRVSGSAPGRAYSVDVLDGQWLRAAMRDGIIPMEHSSLEADTLRLTVDPTKLAPGVYSARLRVHTWQGVNTPELAFKLRVDSPQTVLTPLTVLPAPVEFQPRVQIIEAPSPRAIAPPTVERPAPPPFPKYKPRPKPQPAAKHTHAIGRSRVLPFPKVTIPLPKPKEEKPAAPAKDQAKEPAKAPAKEPAKDAKQEKPAPKQTAKAEPPKPAPAKKEAPPERTKPSAMPPAPAKH